MKYDTVIYCFYSAKKGIDFGKSLFVLEGILTKSCQFFFKITIFITSKPVAMETSGHFEKLMPLSIRTFWPSIQIP